MPRCIAAFGLALGLLTAPSSGSAQESLSLDNYLTAVDLFLPSSEQDAARGFGYAEEITAALEGTWIPLSLLFPPERMAAADEMAEKALSFCGKPGIAVGIAGADRFGFTITRSRGETLTPIEYTALGGSLFAQHGDPAALFAYLGFDKGGENLDPARVTTLQGLFRQVHVFRPYPDVLVLVGTAALPQVYQKCPG